jgi:hypothetical protein
MTFVLAHANSEGLLGGARSELLDIDKLSSRKGPPHKLAYLRLEFGVEHR